LFDLVFILFDISLLLSLCYSCWFVVVAAVVVFVVLFVVVVALLFVVLLVNGCHVVIVV